MSNKINSTTAGAGGLESTAHGDDGILLIQSDGVTVATFNTTGISGDGSQLTGTGGLTLLSTLTTTSGTSHTTATLNLTTYKTLQIYVYSVGNTSGSQLLQFTPNGGSVTSCFDTGPSSVQAYYQMINFDLASGVYGYSNSSNKAQNLTAGVGAGQGGSGANTGLTTSTTSIMFDWSSGATFDVGSIKIYGLK